MRLCVRAGNSYGTDMEKLAASSHRWQTLDLRIHADDFDSMSIARENLPILEVLGISGSSLNELHIFEVAPRLREATLRGAAALQPPSLPWKQLSTLNCGKTTNATVVRELRAFMRLLPRCPNLTKVNLWIDLNNVFPSALELPHLAPNLTDFSIITWDIRGSDPTHIDVFYDILDSLTLPKIRSLGFGMQSSSPMLWPHHHFVVFAARSSCRSTLRSLSLFGIIISDVEIHNCLEDLPHLETLAIADIPGSEQRPEHVVITDTLLGGLTLNTASAPLVPHLHVLRVASLFRFTPGALSHWVSSRLDSGRTPAGPFRLELCHQEDPGPRFATVFAELIALRRRHELSYWLHPGGMPLESFYAGNLNI
ncbi:hypothetical protein C8R46DRAFT_1357702 [Mycena filopes]|nr:hypothetical protein C8R46DRAFT_1357702 [Mycena filopes]